MLLTKLINITMNRGNLGYYNKVMLNKYKIGEIIEVPINLIPKSSYVVVDVLCDICKKESTTTYRNYNDCLNYGFYSCGKCKHIKRKMTNKIKHGIDNYQNVDKIKSTMIDRYGYYNNNRDKSKKTCIDKYGEDNVSKVDSVKLTKSKTNIDNWGVSNVFQSNEIKMKSKKTMLSKFGVEHANQDFNTFNKAQISGYKIKKYGGIYYRGKNELDFIKYCELRGIKVENGPSVKFKIDNKLKVYHSDFYIRDINLICEIKSKYTYDYNKSINDLKRDACIEQGYKFIFIIDMNYTEFNNINQ